jgi:hypothetical protein
VRFAFLFHGEAVAPELPAIARITRFSMLRPPPNRRPGNFTAALATVAFALLPAPTALAQLATLSEFTTELSRSGFGIYSFSVFGTYSDARGPSISSTGQLVPDYSYHTYATGVSTSIGWRTRTSSKFHFSIRFSPSYMYEISSTGFIGHSFTPGNSLTASWAAAATPRWNVSGSLSASLGNFNQLLLTPNADQILTGTPGTSEEFGQTLLTGTSGNSELTTAANSAQSVVEGQESLLYGGFLLNSTATMSASYASTARMHITVSVSGSRTQTLPDPFAPRSAYLLNQTTSLSGSLSVSYRLAERTNANLTVTYARPVSSLYTTSNVSLNAGLSRRLTTHWSASASLGTGYILSASGNANNVPGFQRLGYQASFSTGYRLARNSLRASVSRSVSDNYGLASSATLTASAGWGWMPPRGHWGLSAGASWVRLEGGYLANQGYSFNAAIREALGRRVFGSLGTGYAIASGVTGPGGFVYPRTQTETVQISLGFRPYLGSPDASRLGVPAGVPSGGP